jgi:predicted permease
LARTVLLEGQTAADGRFTLTSVVSPGYLRTMGIPLARGRDFRQTDGKDTPRVAIVNEAAAAHYWPGQETIGKRLRFYGDDKPAEVVGVARTANYQAVGEAPQALIYLSLGQYYFPSASLYVRSAGSPAPVLTAVRRELQRLDRSIWMDQRIVAEALRESLWAPRLAAWLLGIFGALALVLAGIGLYGVAAYSVNQRRREIGVRMALGATPRDIQGMVLLEGVRVVAIGIVTGLAAALPAAHAIRSLLFAISPRDAVTFVAVPAFLALVGVLALWLPAMRATRVEAATALREE